MANGCEWQTYARLFHHQEHTSSEHQQFDHLRQYQWAEDLYPFYLNPAFNRHETCSPLPMILLSMIAGETFASLIILLRKIIFPLRSKALLLNRFLWSLFEPCFQHYFASQNYLRCASGSAKLSALRLREIQKARSGYLRSAKKVNHRATPAPVPLRCTVPAQSISRFLSSFL